MKGRPFRERVGFALAGIKTAWTREASFRTQSCFAVAAIVALVVLRPAPLWWALVALVIAIILALELVNSAIEGVVDLLHPGIHPEIKAIKDMVAGAVLTMSIAALVVGCALFIEQLPTLMDRFGR